MSKQKWDTELYEARHAFVWRFGQGVFELLDAKAGERILDLGCGTGQLTEKIAACGAQVLGLDSSPDMVGQARQNYPNLQFALKDATALDFDGEFDAVFSNAVLHWVRDASGAARGIARALKPGGRFVAEFGGYGNVEQIESAVRQVVGRYLPQAPESRWYFPSIAEYAGVLDGNGLEVRLAELFDRLTPLEGEDGMENWIRQFAWSYFEPLTAGDRERALKEATEGLRPGLYRDGQWFADYRRLRVVAMK
jgi:trans-aconitate methyltransferase